MFVMNELRKTKEISVNAESCPSRKDPFVSSDHDVANKLYPTDINDW